MIYIQSESSYGFPLPHHFDCACAMYGAMDSAMDFKLVTFMEVRSGKFDMLIKHHLFVGSVEFMREVFSRIGKTDVRVPKNSNREHEILTLAEAHERISDGSKLFIKPIEIKLFTGLILDGCIHSCLENLPPDTQVMAYEPFDNKILSEWRAYVHNNKVVGIYNYSGDIFHIPDELGIIDTVLYDNHKSFPCAYTIDVGILDSDSDESHSEVVIEYNDMWAIGNYGLENDRYLRLLKDRYFEIVKS